MERDHKGNRSGIGGLKNSLQMLLFRIVLWAMKRLTILAFILLRKIVPGCRVKDWDFYAVVGRGSRNVYRVVIEDINVWAEEDEIEVERGLREILIESDKIKKSWNLHFRGERFVELDSDKPFPEWNLSDWEVGQL